MADDVLDLHNLLDSVRSLLRDLDGEDLKSLEQLVSDQDRVAELLSNTLGISDEDLKPEQKRALSSLLGSLLAP